MRTTFILTIAFACAGIAGPVQSQGLKDAKRTLTSGKWTVLRSIDPMTDKVDCTGIHDGNYRVQLSADGMYIRIAGGIQSVTLRFDDEPARALRLPTKMEKDVRAIILEGGEYEAATKASRLRYAAITLVAGTAQADLDLTGIGEALEHIKAGCPLPTKAS